MNENTVVHIRDHLVRQFTLPAEQIDALIPGFLAALQDHLTQLEEGLASGDKQLLGKRAHTIKGAFLNLGLEQCAQIAMEIESHSKAGRDLDYAGKVAALRERLKPLLDGEG